MRTNITRMLPGLEAERGVIFPYRVAKTNNPRNYQISYKGVWEKNQNSKFNPNLILGLTGWAVATNDPTASISVKLNCDKGSRWQFDRFRLVGTAQSPDVIPMAIVGTDTIAPIMEPHTNSFLFPCSSTDSITIIFKQNGFTPTLFTISAMIPENNKHGINYHALGVNGASVPAWLRCANFETELKNIKPDLVILAIGINDANVPYGKFSENNFINNYNTLINSIKNVSPHCEIGRAHV